jgi:hypothetical protein
MLNKKTSGAIKTGQFSEGGKKVRGVSLGAHLLGEQRRQLLLATEGKKRPCCQGAL